MTPRLLLLLACFVANDASPAQEPGADAVLANESLRGPAIGEVRDRQGAPWVGAEVVLVSRPLPGNANAGELDRVLAATDARGRFRAEILRGRPYTVFAWGEDTDEGRRATETAECVFVQRPALLRETRLLVRRSVVLAGREQWPNCTGFELRVVDCTGNRQVTWLDVSDGRATLPFLVGPSAFVEVFGKRPQGRCPLARVQVEANEASREVRIELTERMRVTCWVLDHKSRPCPDAAVFQRLGGMLHGVGATDHAGSLSLDIASVASRSPEFSMLVLAQDKLCGICQRVGSGRPGTKLPEGAEPDDLYVNLKSGTSLHARVIGQDGPLAGLEVWCAGIAHSTASSTDAAADTWIRSVFTDAQGCFVIDGGDDTFSTAHLLLRERDYAALPPRWRSGLAPVVFAPLDGQSGRGTPAEPFLVDLRRMCPIELTITEAGGLPAEGVELSLTTLSRWTESPWSWEGSDLRADQRGRVRVLVPGGQRLGFRAVRGLSMLIRAFRTSAGCVDAPPATAQFELSPPIWIGGQVVERSGAPGSGRIVRASYDSHGEPAEWSYQGQDPSVPEGRNSLRVLLLDNKQERVRLTSLIDRPVMTDDEGRFAIPMPADPLPGLMLAARKSGERSFREFLRVPWTGQSQSDVPWRVRF